MRLLKMRRDDEEVPQLTSEEILPQLHPIEERATDALQVFVPGSQAAYCCDCHGVFLNRALKCPGCGSSVFMLISKMDEALGTIGAQRDQLEVLCGQLEQRLREAEARPRLRGVKK